MTHARTLVTVAAALAVINCGATSPSVEPPDDAGVDADTHPVDCQVALEIVDHSPSPNSTLTAKAQALAGSGPYRFAWTATDATGATVSVTSRVTDDSQVDVAIGDPGSYRITVDMGTGAGYHCGAWDAVTANNPTGTNDTVRFRFVPPPSSGLQIQELTKAIIGGTPMTDFNLVLDDGVPLNVTLAGTNAEGQLISADAFVRFIANAKGIEASGFVKANAVFHAVLLEDRYDVLVIPDEATPSFAPALQPAVAFATLTHLSQLVLQDGVVVAGTVAGVDGAGLAGARVQLRVEPTPDHEMLCRTQETPRFAPPGRNRWRQNRR